MILSPLSSTAPIGMPPSLKPALAWSTAASIASLTNFSMSLFFAASFYPLVSSTPCIVAALSSHAQHVSVKLGGIGLRVALGKVRLLVHNATYFLVDRLDIVFARA